MQGLGIYIGRGFHCVAAERSEGRGHLLTNALNEEMVPNAVSRPAKVWVLGSEGAALRRRQPQLVETDPLGCLRAGRPIELAGARLEAADYLALILRQALQTARQRLATTPPALALAVSPEVWPALEAACIPAAAQSQVALAGAWPASLAEAAARWQPGAQAEPSYYLHLHAGGEALYADLMAARGDELVSLASASLAEAGGLALRQALVQWALQRVRQDFGLEGQSQPRFLAALQNSAEVALGDLERFGSGCLVVMGGLQGREGDILDLELDLDLNEYRHLARPGLEVAREELGRLLAGAGLGWPDLARVGMCLRGLEEPLLGELLQERLASPARLASAGPLGESSALAAARLVVGNPWRIGQPPASRPSPAPITQPLASESSAPCPPPAPESPVSSSVSLSQAGLPPEDQAQSILNPSATESIYDSTDGEGQTLGLMEEGTGLLPAGDLDSNGLEMPLPAMMLSGSRLAGDTDAQEPPEAFGGSGVDQPEDPTQPSALAEEPPPAWRLPDMPEPRPASVLTLETGPQAEPPALESTSFWRPGPSAGAKASPSDHPEIVAQRYQVLEALASESYATPYRARDLQNGGTVLLKLFATHKEPAKQAFARALTVRHIRHSNLDAITDLGPHGRGMFLTMADEGRLTVREVLRRRRPGSPLPLDLALGIMQGLGEALRAIHLIQLSHRNIKPEKVRVREHGPGLWLGSFELCQFTPPGLRVRAAAGTPNYMAPEVWRGEPGCASDIFAAAVFLYEMVTGRLPFAGRNPRELEEAIRERQPLPPRQHNQLLPPEMDSLILRGLAKDPRERTLDWAAIGALTRGAEQGR